MRNNQNLLFKSFYLHLNNNFLLIFSEPDPEDKINKELKSVAEEDALRKLLSSDEDDEDEEKKSNDEEEKDKKTKDKEDGKEKVKSKNKKASNKSNNKKGKCTFGIIYIIFLYKKIKSDSSSDTFSSDSSDLEAENVRIKSNKDTTKSRSTTPTITNQESSNKRKMNNMPSDLNASDNSNSPLNTPVKKLKTDGMLPSTFSGVINSNRE